MGAARVHGVLGACTWGIRLRPARLGGVGGDTARPPEGFWEKGPVRWDTTKQNRSHTDLTGHL